MAGYLDTYGVGVDRRLRIIKWSIVSVIAAAIAVSVLVYVFYDFREEQRVKQFFSQLEKKNFRAAYAMFGCTEAKPCTGYAFEKFMEDWGPTAGHDPAQARVVKSRSCGTGVILTVDFGANKQDALWVERKDMSIGFPPFGDVCPSGLAAK